jgi:hypothetical protein
MNKLVVEGGNDRPAIDLDHERGILYIGGSSLPENVTELYGPVLEWIEMYSRNPKSLTTVNFFFEYLNTSSSHMMMRILEKLILLRDSSNLTINWYYPEGDVEMLHFGQELAEFTNFPIHISERKLQ